VLELSHGDPLAYKSGLSGDIFYVPGAGSEFSLRRVIGKDGSLGYIGDVESQKSAIPIIERHVEEIYPDALHLHLFLRYHTRHNIVVPVLDFVGSRMVIAADGAIFRRGSGIVVETCVADCNVIAVYGKEHIGFMHAGRPETVDRIVPEFAKLWRELKEDSANATAIVGPGIGLYHYELGEDVLEQIRHVPELVPQIDKTVWRSWGFNVTGANCDDLGRAGIPDGAIWYSDIDTYGCRDFASDRRERKLNNRHSWRDCYFVCS
jgi:copper oxidase (laccase) domain-containing protein